MDFPTSFSVSFQVLCSGPQGEMDNVPLTEIPFRATEGDLQVEPGLALSEEESE